MRKMKKLVSLVLALVLAFALAAPAFATSTTGGSITIKDPLPGKTYTVYKVFDLVYEGENYSYTIPSDSPWMSVVEEYFTVTAQAATPEVSNAVVKDDFSAADFAKALNEAENKPTVVATWTAPEENAVDHTLTMGDLGYYFVTSEAGSLCMLDNTNPDATIYDKNDKPTIDKTVDDEDKTVYVGQVLTYTVTGHVPSTTGYDKYIYEVSDTMSEGLTFNKDVTVKVGEEKITVTPDYDSITNAFKVSVDVMEYQDQVGAQIEITYTATVNEKAIVNGTEKNKAELKYSNDPTDGNKTDTTPPVEIPVYTAKIIVDKIDGTSKEKLNGAEFVLKNSEGKYYKYTEADGTEKAKVEWVDSVDAATVKTTATVTVDGEEIDGYAEFPGLDDGKYSLVETKAPAGYNKLDKEIEVTVSIIDTENKTENKDVITVSFTSEIENNTGAQLPSTGGIGTTIFYVVGGILVVGAAILLVTRKRVSGDK